jgi:hypothetical protein
MSNITMVVLVATPALGLQRMIRPASMYSRLTLNVAVALGLDRALLASAAAPGPRHQLGGAG